MRLFCAIGWHRAVFHDRWNRGYYFSKCRSCGRDLVRTSVGRWHVPKGYRVVWKPKPAADADWLRWLQDRQISEDMQQQAGLVAISLRAMPAIARGEISSEVRMEQTFSTPTDDQPLPRDDGPGETMEQTVPPLEADAADPVESVSLPADLRPAEDAKQAREASTARYENPPAYGGDFMADRQEGEQAGSLPLSRPDGEAVVPQEPASRAPADDFMVDDMDGSAWSAPHPTRVEIPDFDEDFMADRDDMDRPVAAVFSQSETIEAAQDTAPDPNKTEPENKVKRARRSRKKAAES